MAARMRSCALISTTRLLLSLLILAVCGTVDAQWVDDFESYAEGSIDGLGLWVDFGGSLTSDVSAERASSGSNSLRLAMDPSPNNPAGIPGYGSDVYVDLPTPIQTGEWTLSFQLFVENEFNGTTVAFFSEGPIATQEFDLGMEFNIEGTAITDLMTYNDGVYTTATPLIRDRWVAVESTIDFDNNRLDVMYDGQPFVSGKKWDLGDDAEDAVHALHGFDIWAQGGTRGAVFFDDFAFVPVPEPTGLQLALAMMAMFIPLRRCL